MFSKSKEYEEIIKLLSIINENMFSIAKTMESIQRSMLLIQSTNLQQTELAIMTNKDIHDFTTFAWNKGIIRN